MPAAADDAMMRMMMLLMMMKWLSLQHQQLMQCDASNADLYI
jgi:hypothetical protein